LEPRNQTNQPDRDAMVDDEDDRATSVQQSSGGLFHSFSAPIRYVRSDKNRIGDRIVVGVVQVFVVGAIVAAIGDLTGLIPGGSSVKPSRATTGRAQPTTTPPVVSRPDVPKESGCPPAAENVPCTTVKLERGGLTLATVGLRYSPVRETMWGMVRGLGSEQKLRLVPEDGTPIYARLSPSNTNGDKFFQTHECVRSIQVTEHDGRTLDRKRVHCP
jgi:hypothetical protein